MKETIRTLTAMMTVLAAAGWVSSAGAQTSEPPTSQPPASDSSTDIVVTANKRSESVNDVPMSITAITGDSLVKSGVAAASDLVRVTPGFTFTKTQDAIPVFSIRGVGYYDNNLAATPAVSAYVDEVPLPYPVLTAGALLDLERVEILKGPQGTLFGQNSTGGAINFIAAKPTTDWEGRISAGYGRFNATELNGYVSGPVSDTLGIRIAASHEGGSGWQRSYTRDDRLGHIDRAAGRLLLDWRPSSSVKIQLGLEGWYDKSDSQAPQLVGLAINAPGGQSPLLATGSGTPGDPFVQVYPNAPANARAADWTPGIDYRNDQKYYRASGRIDVDLSPGLTFTSITAYQDLDYYHRVDVDGTSLRIADIADNGYVRSFYQEARLQGTTPRLTWMIGANYSHDRVRSVNLANVEQWSVPLGTGVIDTFNRSTALAGFANAEFKISDIITLQGGARYTEQRQRLIGCPADSGDGRAASFWNPVLGINIGPGDCWMLNDLDGSFAPGKVNIPLKEHNVSWRTGVKIQPNSDTMFYFNISKGYKAGAFTLATFNVFSQAFPATQESLLAYEAGFKFGGPKFQLNGAAFYYDYGDKQLLAPFDTHGPLGVLDKLQNIPKSRIFGAEIQADWRPVEGLRLGANGTFIDSKVRSSFVVPDQTGLDFDVRGERFPYTPRWQATGNADYRFPLSSDLTASLGASVSFRSDTTARFGGGAEYALKGYATLDLRTGLELADGRYAIDIWAHNVTNKYYRLNVVSFDDTIIAFAGQPVTYGVRLTARFK